MGGWRGRFEMLAGHIVIFLVVVRVLAASCGCWKKSVGECGELLFTSEDLSTSEQKSTSTRAPGLPVLIGERLSRAVAPMSRNLDARAHALPCNPLYSCWEQQTPSGRGTPVGQQIVSRLGPGHCQARLCGTVCSLTLYIGIRNIYSLTP